MKITLGNLLDLGLPPISKLLYKTCPILGSTDDLCDGKQSEYDEAMNSLANNFLSSLSDDCKCQFFNALAGLVPILAWSRGATQKDLLKSLLDPSILPENLLIKYIKDFGTSFSSMLESKPRRFYYFFKGYMKNAAVVDAVMHSGPNVINLLKMGDFQEPIKRWISEHRTERLECLLALIQDDNRVVSTVADVYFDAGEPSNLLKKFKREEGQHFLFDNIGVGGVENFILKLGLPYVPRKLENFSASHFERLVTILLPENSYGRTLRDDISKCDPTVISHTLYFSLFFNTKPEYSSGMEQLWSLFFESADYFRPAPLNSRAFQYCIDFLESALNSSPDPFPLSTFPNLTLPATFFDFEPGCTNIRKITLFRGIMRTAHRWPEGWADQFVARFLKCDFSINTSHDIRRIVDPIVAEALQGPYDSCIKTFLRADPVNALRYFALVINHHAHPQTPSIAGDARSTILPDAFLELVVSKLPLIISVLEENPGFPSYPGLSAYLSDPGSISTELSDPDEPYRCTLAAALSDLPGSPQQNSLIIHANRFLLDCLTHQKYLTPKRIEGLISKNKTTWKALLKQSAGKLAVAAWLREDLSRIAHLHEQSTDVHMSFNPTPYLELIGPASDALVKKFLQESGQFYLSEAEPKGRYGTWLISKGAPFPASLYPRSVAVDLIKALPKTDDKSFSRWDDSVINLAAYFTLFIAVKADAYAPRVDKFEMNIATFWSMLVAHPSRWRQCQDFLKTYRHPHDSQKNTLKIPRDGIVLPVSAFHELCKSDKLFSYIMGSPKAWSSLFSGEYVKHFFSLDLMRNQEVQKTIRDMLNQCYTHSPVLKLFVQEDVEKEFSVLCSLFENCRDLLDKALPTILSVKCLPQAYKDMISRCLQYSDVIRCRELLDKIDPKNSGDEPLRRAQLALIQGKQSRMQILPMLSVLSCFITLCVERFQPLSFGGSWLMPVLFTMLLLSISAVFWFRSRHQAQMKIAKISLDGVGFKARDGDGIEPSKVERLESPNAPVSPAPPTPLSLPGPHSRKSDPEAKSPCC